MFQVSNYRVLSVLISGVAQVSLIVFHNNMQGFIQGEGNPGIPPSPPPPHLKIAKF